MQSEYTLLDSVCQLPGARVVDMETGEIISENPDFRGGDLHPQAGGVPLKSGGEADALSSLHIFTQSKYKAELTVNGGLIKVQKPPRDNPPPVGGKRGAITQYSKASKRRMMHTLASVDKDVAGLPVFVTLTYGENFPQAPKIWKNHLRRFYQRMVRKFPDACGIWKLEPQKRGAPHYHLLVWGASVADLRSWVPETWYSIAGMGDEKVLKWHKGGFGNSHCVQKIRSWRGVRSYAAKYLGKLVDCEGWDSPGRFWGVFHRDAVNWSPVVEFDLTRKQACDLMRYFRRYARLKGRDYASLTIMIENPARWRQLLE